MDLGRVSIITNKDVPWQYLLILSAGASAATADPLWAATLTLAPLPPLLEQWQLWWPGAGTSAATADPLWAATPTLALLPPLLEQ